ncbi:glycosyltransferase family 4 protein [Neisseria sp. Ec49-e6-T10]|uniref:glycosyltransferase family 4 protein n=1 Tax=Neisseria sp. Ec49-e6-T10 TaxID=3140744 RepID=UPI003EB9F068
MKIILNIDAIKFPLTGIGRYTYELAKELANGSMDIEELKLMAGYQFCSSLPMEPNSASAFQQSIKLRLQKNVLFSECYRVLYSKIKTFKLKSYSDFIYHSPNFYLPSFSGRSVATFHDLSVFLWPQCHTKERVRFMQKELYLTIKRANALITDSEFTRQELSAYFAFPLERIFNVPLASSGSFYEHSKEDAQSVLARYDLTYKQYSLFIGSIEPRKNLSTLIHAYQRLPIPLRKQYPLVVSGYKGWESGDIHEQMNRGESEGWLCYLGFTPTNDLPALFSGARLFVFPSLYEGFGLPVLESMASGTPVICSNAASLPEVVGDVALMCDALDIDKLTELLQFGLEDEEWRKQATERGLQRSKLFSWRRCAQETINVYQKVSRS